MTSHYMREFQRRCILAILGRISKGWAASRVEFGSDPYLWAERHLYRVIWDWCIGEYGPRPFRLQIDFFNYCVFSSNFGFFGHSVPLDDPIPRIISS